MANSTQGKLKNSGKRADFNWDLVSYISVFVLIVLAIVLRGTEFWGRVLFAGLSLVVAAVVMLAILRGFLLLAHVLNSKASYPMGLLITKLFFGVSIPLLMLRMVGNLMISMLPPYHGGIICDTLIILRQVYYAIGWPTITWWGFVASTVGLGLVALISLVRRTK